jgi:hypothetical protein
VERKGGYGGELLVFAFGMGEREERERRKRYPPIIRKKALGYVVLGCLNTRGSPVGKSPLW